GVADTADPLGGSYAIEALAIEVEEQAITYLEKIDALGGMLRAIETGFVQREIQDAAYKYQRAIESHDAVVVGVNEFQVAEETPIPNLRVDPAIEQAQVERVQAVRERRDKKQAETALARLEECAKGTEN